MREEVEKLEITHLMLLSQSPLIVARNMPTPAALEKLSNEVDETKTINHWLRKQLNEYKLNGQKLNIEETNDLPVPWISNEGFPYELKVPITKEECNNMVVQQDMQFWEFLATNSFPHGHAAFGWQNKS